MKSSITFDEAIKQELKEHPDLLETYEEGLFINAISKMLVESRLENLQKPQKTIKFV